MTVGGLADNLFKTELATATLATGDVQVSNDIAADPHVRFKEEKLARGYLAHAVQPLWVGGIPWGAIGLYAGEKGYFDALSLGIAKELAGELSFGLDRLEKARRLHYLSFYDAVTGLPNRALLEDRIRAVASQIDRGCLLLAGVGRLEEIAATAGTSTTDAVLKQATRRLQENTPDKATLGYVGRGVFALFLPEADPANLSRFATQCLAGALAAPYTIGDHEIGCPVHLGASFFPKDGTTPDALLGAAEQALHRARAQGELFCFYDKDVSQAAEEQLRLEAELRRAIGRAEFVNYYQPKVDLATGKIVGAEALMRWVHPERGLVSPAQFIPALEASGLILESGKQVLAHAIADWRRWRDAGFNPPRIAINVTPAQLKSTNFLHDIETALAANGGEPAALAIELTESSLMSDIQKTSAVLRAVRELGITIAIDDFGTGYSSLAYLVSLPIDELKIDRAFVVKMTVDPAYMALVSTVISLARNLNLKVVAEGVETEEQANLLRLLKCQEAQGYLYSPPVPAERFPALLAAT